MRIVIGIKKRGNRTCFRIQIDNGSQDKVSERNTGYGLAEAFTNLLGRVKRRRGLEDTEVFVEGGQTQVSKTLFKIKDCFELEEAEDGLYKVWEELNREDGKPDLKKIKKLVNSALEKMEN